MLAHANFALVAILVLLTEVTASHGASYHARQHRKSLHRRQIRRVVRDCSGNGSDPSPSAASSSFPYGYTPSGFAQSTATITVSSESATASSPYEAASALPKNALFATNDGDTIPDDSTLDASNSTLDASDSVVDVFGVVLEAIEIISGNVDNGTAAVFNDIASDVDGGEYNGGVFLASDYDTTLDGTAPVVRARRLSSHRQRATVCTHGDWRCTDMDLEREWPPPSGPIALL
jgi:hypothetical protein